MISLPNEVNDTFAILTTYVGETGRTLQKWIEEHKSAVRRGDEKNGIAVDVKKTQHDTNWAEAKVLKSETQYCKRIVEAVNIPSQISTMNLECGQKPANYLLESITELLIYVYFVLYFYDIQAHYLLHYLYLLMATST